MLPLILLRQVAIKSKLKTKVVFKSLFDRYKNDAESNIAASNWFL